MATRVKKGTNIPVDAPNEAQQGQEAPMEATPKSELEQRKMQEIEMLKRTAEHKQMMAQQKPKIGAEEVRKASEILRKYKEGKARLEQKIIANEEFWKLRQWNYMNDGSKDFQPASAW